MTVGVCYERVGPHGSGSTSIEDTLSDTNSALSISRTVTVGRYSPTCERTARIPLMSAGVPGKTTSPRTAEATPCSCRRAAAPEWSVGASVTNTEQVLQALPLLQVANAYRHLYWRPVDALGPFAQANLAAWQRPASVASLKQAALALQRR